MSIRIVSDGTSAGTVVQNDFGMPIGGVKKITWHIEANGLATAIIEFIDVEIEAVAEVEE